MREFIAYFTAVHTEQAKILADTVNEAYDKADLFLDKLYEDGFFEPNELATVEIRNASEVLTISD